MPEPLQRILLLGDAYGMPQLTQRIPRNRIVAIVGAANRPASHASLHEIAKAYNLPFLIQPLYNDTRAFQSFHSAVEALRPDSMLCHSYAMLVRKELRTLVAGNAFNVHAALLPKNRGPNPIQWALIHGNSETGITLHVMDDGFDTGPIIAQRRVVIHDTDSWVTLSSRITEAGLLLLDACIPDLLSGKWQAEAQDDGAATCNARITPESFAIDFSRMDDNTIFNLIRAQVAPLAGAYVTTPTGKIRFTEYIPLSRIAELRHTYG